MKLTDYELEDVKSWDYPDFCDAFISYAEDENVRTYWRTDTEMDRKQWRSFLWNDIRFFKMIGWVLITAVVMWLIRKLKWRY